MPAHIAQDLMVRRLAEADQSLLERMYDKFEPLQEALGLPPQEASRRRTWLATLRESLNLGAFVDGQLAGHAALLAVDADAAELMCFVHQDFRRQGVGTALARTALPEAKEAGYQRISVFLNTHNVGARRGLLRLGFEPVWEDLEEAEYVYWLWGREV